MHCILKERTRLSVKQQLSTALVPDRSTQKTASITYSEEW